MLTIKTEDSIKVIPISCFNECLIDSKTKQEIIEMYPSRSGGAYYLNKFSNFLIDHHGISLKSYIKKFLDQPYPKCPETSEDVGFRITGKGIVFSKYKRGAGVNKKNNKKFKEHCERMSLERVGENNPMYGKKPWNKGSEDFGNKMRSLRLGKKTSKKTKEKQSESAKKRAVHGHTGKKHSEEAKQKMREATAKRYSNGSFSRESSIHIKMREFLQVLDLNADFKEEFFVKYYSLDFAFPCCKIAIEVQGQYFHIDPRFYPDGPQDAIQRRNYGRDKAKRKFLESRGWTIIEVWEKEIKNNEFKEIIKCELQKSNLLNH